MSVTTPQVSTVRKTVLNPVSLSFSNNGGTAYTYCNIFKIKGVVAINSIMLKNETLTSTPTPLVPYSYVDTTILGAANRFNMRPVLRSAGSAMPLGGSANMWTFFRKNSGPAAPTGNNVLNLISQGHYLVVTPTFTGPSPTQTMNTLPFGGLSIDSPFVNQNNPIQDYYILGLSGISGSFAVSDILDNGSGVSAELIAYNALGGYVLVRTPIGGSFSILDIITASSAQYLGVPPSLNFATITSITPITSLGQSQVQDGITSINGTVFEADVNNDTYWSLEFLYNATGTIGTWNPWSGTYRPTIFWTPISADADILQA